MIAEGEGAKKRLCVGWVHIKGQTTKWQKERVIRPRKKLCMYIKGHKGKGHLTKEKALCVY